ncbi:hypothetical protein BRYFOR_09545 [Marvinbryantia formatexigens DSM 14469]|uniref:Uncharacterized protein n=1 Tax=Marvinbryantia formatexigens DSM 14469 TaxID=478749 RepID=C6LLJ7_9FIRM|nr:hypothetical protein BRYFOR_09545 [Marvinbryantia formatexigens DSM 14469]
MLCHRIFRNGKAENIEQQRTKKCGYSLLLPDRPCKILTMHEDM